MKPAGRALIALLFSIATLAATHPALARVSMTVQPLVAEFTVAPGESGHISVTVSNSGTSAQLITARRVDWRTVADGSIALEKVGAEKRHSIARNLSLSSYQFTLQPGQRREVSLTLSMPAALPKAPGAYWGGFILNASDLDAPRAAVGVAATVFVYDSVSAPSRTLNLQSMHVSAGGGKEATLVARLRNTGQSYLRPLAHLTVAQAGRVLLTAPVTINAVFPDAIRILSQPLGHLPPGEYRVELTIDYGGNSIIDGVTTAHIQ